MFSLESRFTDDSVMTLAVANARLMFDRMSKDQNIDRLKCYLVTEMHRLGAKYPYAGYGRRFFSWLLEKNTSPYGSYGNGSAMRVSPVAWYASSLEECIDFAKASAEVTHNHPEGIKGAVVTAGAVYLARMGKPMEEIRKFVDGYYKIDFTLDEIRPTYRFNETCQGSVPQAMEAFFESVSFEDAIRNAISIGGDSDTIGAITGAVAEAYYGMSEAEKEKVEERLDTHLARILSDFQKKFMRS